MTTIDYVVIMIGLSFIAETLGDTIKSRRMHDCKEKKIQELEERVTRLEKN